MGGEILLLNIAKFDLIKAWLTEYIYALQNADATHSLCYFWFSEWVKCYILAIIIGAGVQKLMSMPEHPSGLVTSIREKDE